MPYKSYLRVLLPQTAEIRTIPKSLPRSFQNNFKCLFFKRLYQIDEILKYKDIAFVKADKMPTFDGRGNINDFINWCSTQLNYNNGTAGMRVVMQFVIETDGSIKEINALQGDAKSCAEVERVIRRS